MWKTTFFLAFAKKDKKSLEKPFLARNLIFFIHGRKMPFFLKKNATTKNIQAYKHKFCLDFVSYFKTCLKNILKSDHMLPGAHPTQGVDVVALHRSSLS